MRHFNPIQTFFTYLSLIERHKKEMSGYFHENKSFINYSKITKNTLKVKFQRHFVDKGQNSLKDKENLKMRFYTTKQIKDFVFMKTAKLGLENRQRAIKNSQKKYFFRHIASFNVVL